MAPNERIRLIRTYHELWLLNYDTGHGRAVFSQESAAESYFFLIAVERQYRTLVLPSLCASVG